MARVFRKRAAALAQAKENFRALGLANVEARLAEWLDAFLPHEKFDVIASNPPYLTSAEAAARSGDLAHEPLVAFDGGEDGLDAIRAVARGATRHLKPGGMLLVEHGSDQKDRVRKIMDNIGFSSVETFADLAGLPRITACRAPDSGQR